MTDNTPTTYATIAEAEAVIMLNGYRRDSQRHVWIDAAGGKTAKVLRTTDSPTKFFIRWG